MAFCTKCGKEINDGEVCSCQTVKAASNVDVADRATGIVGNAQEIVADPEVGTKKFVEGASWVTMSIMAGIYAIITVLFNIISKIRTNIRHKKDTLEWVEDLADAMDMDVDEYCDEYDVDLIVYKFGDFLKGAFIDILEVAAGIALMAVATYFAVILVKKIKITWQQAFAIAVVELMVVVPLVLVNNILGFIPSFKLLSWIMSAIYAVRNFGAIVLTYFGIKAVCGDSKSTVYAAVPAIAACSLASSLVFFILNSIFY